MCLRRLTASIQAYRISSTFSSILTVGRSNEDEHHPSSSLQREQQFKSQTNKNVDHDERFPKPASRLGNVKHKKPENSESQIHSSNLVWNPERDQWETKSTPHSSSRRKSGRWKGEYSYTKDENILVDLTGKNWSKSSEANHYNSSCPNKKQYANNSSGHIPKPRGKRERKKEKLGFIESETEPEADAEQILYGLHPVQLALSAGRRTVQHVYHRDDTGGRLAKVLANCVSQGIPTTKLPTAQLDRITGGTGVHQGVCARVSQLQSLPVSGLLQAAGYPMLKEVMSNCVRMMKMQEGILSRDKQPTDKRRLWLLLDRVQDPMNFGSILRSSYFLGVDAVLVPDRNSCPLSPTVSKASAGVLEVFPVYSVPADSCVQLLLLLQQHCWQLLAAGAGGDRGHSHTDLDTLLIVGNEGRGVDRELTKLCRQVSIPSQRHLADGVESLNVGVATGILLSQLMLAR